MEMMRDVILLLFGIGMLVGCIILLKQLIQEIKKIKIKSDDGNIEAIVVDYEYAGRGDIHPILQYNVNGIEKKYTYHFFYSSKEYPVGKKVNLKFSQESGLAYNKTDLIKKLIEVIKTKPDDLNIGAEIICVEPVSSGKKSRLLVRYNIEGRQKNYIYYSSRPPEEYIVGNEVILKLCQKNGLVYDKKFLKKRIGILVCVNSYRGVIYNLCGL